jgi:hypothetical protein
MSSRQVAMVVVLFEPGRSGAEALAQASAIAEQSSAELKVVVLAPQAPVPRCCGASPAAYNCAVRDEAAAELDEAARLLGWRRAGRTSFEVLVEGRDPPLPTWIAQRRCDLVLLPARRRVLRTRGHPAARALRRSTQAEIREVSGRTEPHRPRSG